MKFPSHCQKTGVDGSMIYTDVDDWVGMVLTMGGCVGLCAIITSSQNVRHDGVHHTRIQELLV
jgi:hypothetical protein